MILWDLTCGCAKLGFGNDVIVHFFLPILHSVLLRSVSRRKLLLFHFCFVRSTFLPIPCSCGHSGPTLLCSSSRCCEAVSTPPPGQVLQGGLEQLSSDSKASEFSSCLQLAWAQTAHKSHLHLWQETFLSCSRCSCPPDKGHRKCLHRQTGQAEASQRHRAMHCMEISVPLSALQCFWVHIKFIPLSTSWAALEYALKVLLQASQMDRRWIWPGALSLWYCCTPMELHSKD